MTNKPIISVAERNRRVRLLIDAAKAKRKQAMQPNPKCTLCGNPLKTDHEKYVLICNECPDMSERDCAIIDPLFTDADARALLALVKPPPVGFVETIEFIFGEGERLQAERAANPPTEYDASDDEVDTPIFEEPK